MNVSMAERAALRKPIATRDAFGKALIKLGESNPDVIVFDADIAKSTKSAAFHTRFPDRAFDVGIAEQNMMTAASGLATTGKIVFATTYAVFASMRACEQIRTFICYPKTNVKIAASHGGLQVSSDGATHQATEDLAILRSFPNMTILNPADDLSTEWAVFAAAEYFGPVYIRLTRNPVPPIYDDVAGFVIGRANVLRSSPKDQVSLIATGLMVSKALEAAKRLEAVGVAARVIDVHTIKPIDHQTIAAAARETGGVVTAEDHQITGGLGSSVAEVLGEEHPVPMERIGLRDAFGESGDPEELFTLYQMNTEHIVEAALRVIRRKPSRPHAAEDR